tara:strand:+ start:36003 stop:36971 length:969 start_codon:yes stop_codon:yes gene_type:complete
MKVLITGGDGFIGSATLRYLALTKLHDAVGMVRPKKNFFPELPLEYRFCDLLFAENDGPNLKDIDVVVHTAAMVHRTNNFQKNFSEGFMKMNCNATLKLAEHAAKEGVKRFIFLSSIKVNGEKSELNKPFRYDDPKIGDDPYGKSKSKAEMGLLKIASNTSLDVTIIRPPLVYGPGVKANFATLLKFASRNIPLPLGSINNKRSFVALDNLISLIVICIDHPKAANEIFLVSDGEDISTEKLYTIMSEALGKKALVFKFDKKILKRIFLFFGISSIINRLCDDLRVDIQHTKDTLDWNPVISILDGVKKCVPQEKRNKSKSM